MRSPCLKDLPPPPPGRTGWPWTEEGEAFPDAMPDGSTWPRLSIVTPSYNQGGFIEETIRSVLLQGYPDLEYILIDGGSQDNTPEIIRRYEPYLACWVSEPDGGQTDALNKGFARVTGDIVAWLNSDDCYVPATFRNILRWMCPTGGIVRPIVYGDCELVDAEGRVIKRWHAKPVSTERLLAFWRGGYLIPQQTVFMSRHTLRDISLDASLRYAMDWELYLRLSMRYPFVPIPEVLARFRMHGLAKTAGGARRFAREQLRISMGYWEPGLQTIRYRIEYLLAPVIQGVCGIPRCVRRVLGWLLPEQTYDMLRGIKRRLLPRHGCPIREEERYL
ncbi:MAG: glycosyltransferase family 2 protein [bacterium]